MLELVSSGLVSLWLQMAGIPQTANSITLVTGQEAPWMVLPGEPDSAAQVALQQHLENLAGKGFSASVQGVWLQSGPTLLASNQGTTPFPAASLTKVATSLVALHTWGANHQFETLVSATGPIQNGVLQGDLVIQGSGDPLMVWEEAIALANDLNQAGVTRVAGNLVITGNFLMNFEMNPQKAGELFRQALDAKKWGPEAEAQYAELPKGTPRPQITIAGTVQAVPHGAAVMPKQMLLLRHRSLPMSQIVKLMNIYSNNIIAESLANSLGGAPMVAQQTALITGVPQAEILLSNGSGLGVENQISPRAVCTMFATLQRYLQANSLTLADLFPVSGRDKGTIEDRSIPKAAVVKTGTLNDVSTLAGVVPTRDRGLVWFAILNRGNDLDGLRAQQDSLLQALVRQWGAVASPPVAITPTAPVHSVLGLVGDDRRNEIVQSAVETNWYRQ